MKLTMRKLLLMFVLASSQQVLASPADDTLLELQRDWAVANYDLEKAMELDANALDGSAYTSLGTLYFKVPGWPVGFGSDKKAAQLLEQALAINPDGIDPNYFYADYLISRKNYNEAEQFLLKAQQAAPRAGRERADAGRQAEIRDALASVREKLGHASS